ncbi:MAG TPA: PQQ-dependent sugar dehydrogenase [Chloroflexia bacterium]|jgi:glucose/arabinose dehydrogenase/plastocyanin
MQTGRSIYRLITNLGLLLVVISVAAFVLISKGDIAQAAPGAPLSPEAVSEPLPAGVISETVLPNMDRPIAMAFDPEGRLFYTEKVSGKVRLFQNGVLQPAAVYTFSVQSANEQGLLGIALDPNFTTNHYIYVFYTCGDCATLENRVVRFTETNGVGSNVQLILSIPNDTTAQNHNGGNIHFGPDGKLYVSTGDDGNTAYKSQDMSLMNGKILRIEPSNGSAPTNNPFYNDPTVSEKRIYAYGLRNPFDFTFDSVIPGRIFGSENGPNCDDELNRIEAGYNYGWRPDYPCDDNNPDPAYNTLTPTLPLLWYLGTGSPDNTSCCIAPTGVEVYSSTTGTLISEWTNHLFMCAYSNGALYHFYLNNDRTNLMSSSAFATVSGVNCSMDIETGPDGALYYIQGGGYVSGTLKRLRFAGSTTTVTPSASNTPAGTATPTGSTTPTRTATIPAQTATSTPSVTATATTTACDIQFQDVAANSTFYPYITCLACRDILGGYPCGGAGEPCGTSGDPYYRPGANITRGQISKIVSEAAGFAEDPGAQVYEDVEPGSPFYAWINRLSNRGHMSGYPCGGPGESCEAGGRPYFRPNANATRGQLSKIVSNAAEFDEEVTGQTYADVPVSSDPSSFYTYIERLSDRQVMGGYACGTADPNSGPCDDQDKPYFRPGNLVTRGQAAKIVGNTFYPNCDRGAEIRNFAYTPEELTVEVGTTVRWTNFDLDYHTVTSSEPSGPLDSPHIQRDETWAYTFNTPGEYEYYCEPHPYMRGKVIVTP